MNIVVVYSSSLVPLKDLNKNVFIEADEEELLSI